MSCMVATLDGIEQEEDLKEVWRCKKALLQSMVTSPEPRNMIYRAQQEKLAIKEVYAIDIRLKTVKMKLGETY